MICQNHFWQFYTRFRRISRCDTLRVIMIMGGIHLIAICSNSYLMTLNELLWEIDGWLGCSHVAYTLRIVSIHFREPVCTRPGHLKGKQFLLAQERKNRERLGYVVETHPSSCNFSGCCLCLSWHVSTCHNLHLSTDMPFLALFSLCAQFGKFVCAHKKTILILMSKYYIGLLLLNGWHRAKDGAL